MDTGVIRGEGMYGYPDTGDKVFSLCLYTACHYWQAFLYDLMALYDNGS